MSLENPKFWKKHEFKNGTNCLIHTDLAHEIERDLVRKLRSDNLDSHHFWYGIVSGFPLCCIDWFINCWVPMRMEKRMFSGIPEVYDWSHDQGHVECPECLIKRVEKQFRRSVSRMSKS